MLNDLDLTYLLPGHVHTKAVRYLLVKCQKLTAKFQSLEVLLKMSLRYCIIKEISLSYCILKISKVPVTTCKFLSLMYCHILFC